MENFKELQNKDASWFVKLGIAENEREEVLNFLDELNVDPLKFGGNLELLASGGIQAVPEPLPSTASIKHYMRFHDRPGHPTWAVAAIPDVIFWMAQQSLKASENNGEKQFIMSILSLNEGSAESQMDKYINAEGSWTVSAFRKAVQAYCSITGLHIETMKIRVNYYFGCGCWIVIIAAVILGIMILGKSIL